MSVLRGSITALLCLATSAQAAFARPIPDTPIINFDQVTSKLYRGAAPSHRALVYLKDHGFHTVIDTRVLGSSREERDCQRMSMKYVHLPLTIFMVPSKQTVDKFFNLVGDKSSGKIYLHCLAGGDRTGILVAIYRMRMQHWSFDQAYAEMKDHNFRPWLTTLIETVRDANTLYANVKPEA